MFDAQLEYELNGVSIPDGLCCRWRAEISRRQAEAARKEFQSLMGCVADGGSHSVPKEAHRAHLFQSLMGCVADGGFTIDLATLVVFIGFNP